MPGAQHACLEFAGGSKSLSTENPTAVALGSGVRRTRAVALRLSLELPKYEDWPLQSLRGSAPAPASP